MSSPFSNSSTGTIAELGEIELIRKMRDWLGAVSPPTPFGIGDDCAVLELKHRLMIATTDSLVYNHHFDDTASAEQAGAKLIKRNLSDIAAMGGHPQSACLALLMSPDTKMEWLREFYQGVSHCCQEYGVQLVGGDISTAHPQAFAASLTLWGYCEQDPIKRRGARPGDNLFVTGSLGGSRLGKHLDFNPRLKEGLWLARQPTIRSMIDITDGLYKDLPELLPETCDVLLNIESLPISKEADHLAQNSEKSALEHALGDGEDYELLFAIDAVQEPSAFIAEWKQHLPATSVTHIGSIVTSQNPEQAPQFINAQTHQPILKGRGYEHLKTDSLNILTQLKQGIITHSAQETEAIAEKLALVLPEDHTLGLYGDLGVGKTTFVRGLARAWDVQESITSPTFNIFTLYRGKRNLLHLDAFHIETEDQIESLMLEEFLQHPWCLAIEWPENLGARLPKNIWRLYLEIIDQGQHKLILKEPRQRS